MEDRGAHGGLRRVMTEGRGVHGGLRPHRRVSKERRGAKEGRRVHGCMRGRIDDDGDFVIRL